MVHQKKPNALAICRLPFRVIVLTIAGFLLVLVMPPHRASGALFNIQTGLSMSEEYTDNLFLSPNDRQQDFVSQAVPSVKLVYKTGFWDWDLDYAYIYRNYSQDKITDDSTQTANVIDKMELIDNTLFVTLKDTYSRISLNTARDYTLESQVVNQTDANVFTVNPYIIKKITDSTTAVLGYSYVDTWYKEPTVITTLGLPETALDTIAQTESVELRTELSSVTTLTTGVRYTQNMNSFVPFDELDVYTGPSYTFAPNSHVYISLGNSFFDFDMTGQTREHTSRPFWNAGIMHQYSTITLSFDTALSYIPDPVEVVRMTESYIATLKKTVPRMTMLVSGGFTQYRNAEKTYLEDSAYSLTGSINYALSPTSKVDVGVSIEYLREYPIYINQLVYQNDVNQTVYLNHLRFEHTALKNLTLALEYDYSNAYAPAPTAYYDNYWNNRITGEMSIAF